MALNRKTNSQNFILTTYLTSKPVNKKVSLAFENYALKNKIRLYCMPVRVTKKQLKNLAKVCAIADIRACIISPELSKTVLLESDILSKEAQFKKTVNFAVAVKGKLFGHYLETPKDSFDLKFMKNAIGIMSKIYQK